MKRANPDIESPENPETSRQRIKSSSTIEDADEINTILPSFNPSSSSSITAEQWIGKIECLRLIYKWDDQKTLGYAILRLDLQGDDDKIWLSKNVCNWTEFKEKLVKRFPKRSKTDYFDRLKRRHKKSDETFENYIKDVERFCKKCDCNLEDTIIYIILGLEDSLMRKELFASKCKTIGDLLSRMKLFPAIVKKKEESKTIQVVNHSTNGECDHGHQNNASVSQPKIAVSERVAAPRTPRSPQRSPNHMRQPSNESVNNEPIVCQFCNKVGHYSVDCYRDPKNFCENCEKFGHSSGICHSSNDRGINPKKRNKRNNEHFANGHTYCKICQMRGHHTIDCKYNRNSSYQGSSNQQLHRNEELPYNTNAKSRKLGHYSVNCPNTDDVQMIHHSTRETNVNSERSRPPPPPTFEGKAQTQILP